MPFPLMTFVSLLRLRTSLPDATTSLSGTITILSQYALCFSIHPLHCLPDGITMPEPGIAKNTSTLDAAAVRTSSHLNGPASIVAKTSMTAAMRALKLSTGTNKSISLLQYFFPTSSLKSMLELNFNNIILFFYFKTESCFLHKKLLFVPCF